MSASDVLISQSTKKFADFVVTDSPLVAPVRDEASPRNAYTVLQSESERMLSTTDHIREISMFVRELLASKHLSPR